MQTRTIDIAVSILFISVAAVVMYDSRRLGAGWGFDGPETGYFPFYVALIMFVASAVTLVQAARHGAGESFVGRTEFGRVLMVLIPTTVYVAAIPFTGIYLAAAVFIAFFMLRIGRYGVLPSLAVGAAVPVLFFMLFEVWFLVPLPKGPVETALGY